MTNEELIERARAVLSCIFLNSMRRSHHRVLPSKSDFESTCKGQTRILVGHIVRLSNRLRETRLHISGIITSKAILTLKRAGLKLANAFGVIVVEFQTEARRSNKRWANRRHAAASARQ